MLQRYDENQMNRAVRSILAILLGAAALPLLCRAEPRWCSTSGEDPSNKFIYPQIARAARATGFVLVRMVYVPNGKVVRIEPVSGPRLLSDSLTGQLMNWIVRTDADGDEFCETLVIAKFTMPDSGREPPQEPSIDGSSSILRLSAEIEPLPADFVIEDPAPLHGFKLFRSQVNGRIHRVAQKVFGGSN
jgi:hypothetical protein